MRSVHKPSITQAKIKFMKNNLLKSAEVIYFKRSPGSNYSSLIQSYNTNNSPNLTSLKNTILFTIFVNKKIIIYLFNFVVSSFINI